METKGTFGAGPNSCCEGSLTPAQMELVLRSLPVQISVMDEQGTMVYWRGDSFADCDPKHIGVHINESHKPESQQEIAELEAAFRDGSRDGDVQTSVHDGSVTLVCHAPLRDEDGAYRGMVETLQDITEVAGLPVEESASE